MLQKIVGTHTLFAQDALVHAISHLVGEDDDTVLVLVDDCPDFIAEFLQLGFRYLTFKDRVLYPAKILSA